MLFCFVRRRRLVIESLSEMMFRLRSTLNYALMRCRVGLIVFFQRRFLFVFVLFVFCHLPFSIRRPRGRSRRGGSVASILESMRRFVPIVKFPVYIYWHLGLLQVSLLFFFFCRVIEQLDKDVVLCWMITYLLKNFVLKILINGSL